MNLIAQLEFELACNNVTDQLASHYATSPLPSWPGLLETWFVAHIIDATNESHYMLTNNIHIHCLPHVNVQHALNNINVHNFSHMKKFRDMPLLSKHFHVRRYFTILSLGCYCYVLTFDPAQKCTGRKWHIPMASNRKRSRGRIKAYNMGQGEGPMVPLQWCTGRE